MMGIYTYTEVPPIPDYVSQKGEVEYVPDTINQEIIEEKMEYPFIQY